MPSWGHSCTEPSPFPPSSRKCLSGSVVSLVCSSKYGDLAAPCGCAKPLAVPSTAPLCLESWALALGPALPCSLFARENLGLSGAKLAEKLRHLGEAQPAAGMGLFLVMRVTLTKQSQLVGWRREGRDELCK